MGATTMKAVACSQGDWTLIADGAAVSAVGLQPAMVYPVAITIASALPAADSDDWIRLPDEGFSARLETADKLYARPLDQASKVRLYKVAR